MIYYTMLTYIILLHAVILYYYIRTTATRVYIHIYIYIYVSLSLYMYITQAHIATWRYLHRVGRAGRFGTKAVTINKYIYIYILSLL